jgi:DnaK suppressor protein
MQDVKLNTIDLPVGYKPTEDEDYMNPMQLEYFRRKLDTWKDELYQESQETLLALKDDKNFNEPDPHDRATVEEDTYLELRTRDRYRKLLQKINEALERIKNGTYGYCEHTGEEIGLKRLEARPIATLSIKAQEYYENYERTHSDED